MSAEITDAMRWRYLNDVSFHAQVYRHAMRTCEPHRVGRGAVPCGACIEAAISLVSAKPWVGRTEGNTP